MKDYYSILGVDKKASKEDIKKAFRKLAHEHHPDKTKNDPASSQKFKEASEAYSVLSDDTKRAQYDTYGQYGPSTSSGQGGFGGFGGQGFGGFDFSGFQQAGGVEFDLGDVFSSFFGGRGGQAKQQRGDDISIDIELSFEESIFGVERDISVTKNSTCTTCKGSGGAPGTEIKTCSTCSGKGKIHEVKRSILGNVQTTRVCDTCHGKGQIPKVKCSTCHGEGVTEREQEISVKIPAGIESGQMVRLSGMGEAISSGTPGDLYIKVYVTSHRNIRKDGYNLITETHIKLSQAVLGDTITFQTLDGVIDLSIPAGTNNGEVLRIKGKGVPHGSGKRGDMLVEVVVDMPRKLSKAAKQAIESLKKEGF